MDKQKHTALLPCPFCDEKRISLNPPDKSINFKGSINCPSCLVSMPREVDSDDELIGCWNTRAVNTYPAVEDLVEALTLCQSALAMMVAPDAIKSSSVMHAFAQATEAECKARSALNRFRSLEAGNQ